MNCKNVVSVDANARHSVSFGSRDHAVPSVLVRHWGRYRVAIVSAKENGRRGECCGKIERRMKVGCRSAPVTKERNRHIGLFHEFETIRSPDSLR